MKCTCIGAISCWLAIVSVPGLAQGPVEELPPPADSSVLVKEGPVSPPVPSNPEIPIKGEVPSAVSEDPALAATQPMDAGMGWGLIGPTAKHYVVGSLAIADYWRDGQRQVVAMEEEDPASHAKPDPNYRYYREPSTGHRWAIARQPLADGGFSVYFQLSDKPGTWTRVQSARPTWETRFAESFVVPFVWVESTCGK